MYSLILRVTEEIIRLRQMMQMPNVDADERVALENDLKAHQEDLYRWRDLNEADFEDDVEEEVHSDDDFVSVKELESKRKERRERQERQERQKQEEIARHQSGRRIGTYHANDEDDDDDGNEDGEPNTQEDGEVSITLKNT